MNTEKILEKMNNGEEVSNIEVIWFLLAAIQGSKGELEDDINRLARSTMAEFDKVYTEFDKIHVRIDGVEEIMVTKSDLNKSEGRLNLKVEVSHGVTNRRIDWLESKIKKLA